MMLNLESLCEQVYQFLRKEMQNGKLLPGLNIDVKKISQQLGVSKTPIRDALIQLQVEGFVTILPRRGIRVNALTLRDVKNLYEVIGPLEASVIISVFHKLDQIKIAKMEQINSEYRQAILTEDFEHIYSLNLAFHEVFLRLSDNLELRRIIKPLKERLYDFPRRGYLLEWELRNLDEHQQLVDFIKKGDRDAAGSILRDVHWSYVVQEEFIRKFYETFA